MTQSEITLGLYPREMKSCLHKNVYKMFTGASIIKVNKWKHGKCSSGAVQVRCGPSMHNGTLFNHNKK